MAVIGRLLDALFGTGRNVVAETAGIFIENADMGAARATALQTAALSQFGQEFAVPRKGAFDRLMDGVNRLPRPALALGTLGLFVSAMVDPVWFAARMQGIALVPEPLWWLLGVIVSFYFGARHQAKGQDFQRELATTLAQAPQVVASQLALERLRRSDAALWEPGETEPTASLAIEDPNPALDAWQHGRRPPATM